jgi:hypothetical protein
VFGTGAARPLIDAAINVGCNVLAALLEPLLASLGTLLDTLDDDASPLLIRAGRSHTALVLAVRWVATLRHRSVVLLVSWICD